MYLSPQSEDLAYNLQKLKLIAYALKPNKSVLQITLKMTEYL